MNIQHDLVPISDPDKNTILNSELLKEEINATKYYINSSKAESTKRA